MGPPSVAHAVVSRSGDLLAADVFSVPGLVDRKRGQADAQRLRVAIADLPRWRTGDLLPRFETVSEPLMLWALHLEASRRGVPPVLRWPPNELGPQGDFLNLAADVKWLQTETPYHRAIFRGWRSVLRQSPGSDAWHEHVHRQFLFAFPRSLSFIASKGLGLIDVQRQLLLSMPTASMARERAALRGPAFADLGACLLDHAYRHPDRSGSRTPEQIVNRRVRLYRIHVLAGRSPSRTATHWLTITGEPITRQAVAKQVAAVEGLLG